MNDPIILRIEAFRCATERVPAERRNRGCTICEANSGASVARLRPTKNKDL